MAESNSKTVSNPNATNSSNSSNKVQTPEALTKLGYSLGDAIGSGQFATVYMATNANKTSKHIACKRIEIEKVPFAWKDRCMRLEIKVLKKLVHPHIVKVYDLVKTRSNVFIFMEYCPEGSIYKKLQKQKKPFSEIIAKVWFAQILGALSYCHSKGIAHRDIKLDNFLLNSDSDALLTDFGFSTLSAKKHIDIMRDTTCGHPAYMAPEVFAETKIWPYDAKAADMYSMGVCLFEMLNFDKPFDQNRAVSQPLQYVIQQRNREYRLHGPIDKTLSVHIKELLNQLLDPNPSTRITSDQALIHKGIVLFLNQ